MSSVLMHVAYDETTEE